MYLQLITRFHCVRTDNISDNHCTPSRPADVSADSLAGPATEASCESPVLVCVAKFDKTSVFGRILQTSTVMRPASVDPLARFAPKASLESTPCWAIVPISHRRSAGEFHVEFAPQSKRNASVARENATPRLPWRTSTRDNQSQLDSPRQFAGKTVAVRAD